MSENIELSSVATTSLYQSTSNERNIIKIDDKFVDILTKINKTRDQYIKDMFNNSVGQELLSLESMKDIKTAKVKKPGSIGDYINTEFAQEYSTCYSGDIVVPIRWNAFPMEVPIDNGSENSWTAIQEAYRTEDMPCRKWEINNIGMERNYTLTKAAAQTLQVLMQNSSIDEIGNVFGRSTGSIWSPDFALAFNAVTTDFSLTPIFYKALSYMMQQPYLLPEGRRNNGIHSDVFPGCKRLNFKAIGTINNPASQGGLTDRFGYGTDSWIAKSCYCTLGQFAAMKKGTLSYTNNSFLADIIAKPDEWAYVPIRGDRIGSTYTALSETPASYIASHMQYPLKNSYYTSRFQNDYMVGGWDADIKVSEQAEMSLTALQFIPGAKNILFVILGNTSLTQTDTFEINVADGDFPAPHWSAVAVGLNTAKAALLRDNLFNSSAEAIRLLLDVYGCSEGLELALKMLPTNYAFGQTPTITWEGNVSYPSNGRIDNEELGALMRVYTNKLYDPFGKPYYGSDYFWLDSAKTMNGLPCLGYRMPKCTNLQSLAVAARVFENLGDWEFNEVTAKGKYENIWFYSASEGIISDMIRNYMLRVASATGAVTTMVGRSLGLTDLNVFGQPNASYANPALQIQQILADKSLYTGYGVRNLSLYDLTEDYAPPSCNDLTRVRCPAYNVGISNLFDQGYNMDWDTTIFDRVKNSTDLNVRFNSGRSYRCMKDNIKVASLNLVSAIRSSVEKLAPASWDAVNARRNWYALYYGATPFNISDQFRSVDVRARVGEVVYLPMRATYQIMQEPELYPVYYDSDNRTSKFTYELMMPFMNHIGKDVQGSNEDIFLGWRDNFRRETVGIELGDNVSYDTSIVFANDYSDMITTLNSIASSFQD